MSMDTRWWRLCVKKALTAPKSIAMMATITIARRIVNCFGTVRLHRRLADVGRLRDPYAGFLFRCYSHPSSAGFDDPGEECRNRPISGFRSDSQRPYPVDSRSRPGVARSARCGPQDGPE